MCALGTPGGAKPQPRPEPRRPEFVSAAGPVPDQRFPKRRRIGQSLVFENVFRKSHPFVGRYMVLRQQPGEGGDQRLGVIASKRTFRRAVDRNRARRLIREAFRLNRRGVRAGSDLVIVARQRILQAGLAEIEKDFRILAGKAGIEGEHHAE